MKAHKLTPYTTTLVILVTSDPVKDMKKLNKKYGPMDGWIEFTDKSAACTYSRVDTNPRTGKPSHYVFVILGPHGYDFDTIAHESVHVVNFCFSYHGVVTSAESDEHFAYQVGHVANLIAQEGLKATANQPVVGKKKPESESSISYKVKTKR